MYQSAKQLCYEFTTSFQLNWAIQNLYISHFNTFFFFQRTRIWTLGFSISTPLLFLLRLF